jgi:hypothetical protein
MNVTTEDLKKGNYGTPCGTVGKSEKSLSYPLVIEFIDKFFGGVLSDVETYEEDGHILIAGGQPQIKKMSITKEEYEYFTNYNPKVSKRENIKFYAEMLDISTSEFKDFEENLDSEEQCNLICIIFSEIVDFYDGAFRCDYMFNGDGMVDLESE